MKPVIGILYCGFSSQNFHRQTLYVTAAYVSAVERSGGLPIIVPYISNVHDIASYIKACDGFLFCGGDDITPSLFHEELLTDQGRTDQKTDLFHLTVMRKVLHERLPVFGICRGMQVLNLALGGSIYQDLSLRSSSSLNHIQRSENRSDLCHKIFISKNSLLYNFCGESCYVNSYHHQSVKKFGKNLLLSAIASDGVVEAVEHPDLPFVLGVQWHPECLIEESSAMQNLFQYFIDQASRSKTILIPKLY